MAEKKFFTVKEVAQELGISKQTLLRYEKKGVFPKPGRHPINNWRRYTIREIEKLKKILLKEEGQEDYGGEEKIY
ncbi:MAG TPA: MerR family transcriptional regulator [Candidatus Omnitrophica bacterium]|nr:MAG: hypothetical protein DRP61_02395 [Candidatus Omnitrophota bacterium]RKY35709.1 MAG: hypothetical protein DRP69_00405 [Candidatus Omnitrophota bacterium]RKY43449.1 MAG: hypothetical protein DRP80_05265 [Candidatus Omnitrophota bacterium]HEC69301.1 MerR family transcriptional regulator [Candidatus Omnitrophota bacterium]